MSEASSAFRVVTRTRHTPLFMAIGALILAALIAMPFVASRSLLKDLFFILTLMSLAQYWNLLAGYAGLVSIGQQAFVGFGAYMLFTLTIFASLDPVLAIFIAGILSALISFPTARLIFRLRGAYFGIGTWVISEVFRLGFAQVKSLGGGTGTSLPTSVTNEGFSVTLTSNLLGVRAAAARDILAYWLALLIALGTLALIYRLLRSRQGLALAAIRDNESAAGSIGIDEHRTKAWVYAVAAFGAGTVGALMFFQTARISPDAAFSVVDFTAFVLFVVVIGGIGTMEGPILGAIILYLLRNQLAAFGVWYLIILGGLAVAIMLFFPNGIWGTIAQKYDIHLFPIRRRLELKQDQLR